MIKMPLQQAPAGAAPLAVFFSIDYDTAVPVELLHERPIIRQEVNLPLDALKLPALCNHFVSE